VSNTFNSSDFETFTTLEGHDFAEIGAVAAAKGRLENCITHHTIKQLHLTDKPILNNGICLHLA